MVTFCTMIIFYTKWWFLEIEVGLFGLLTILWKHHSWTESMQVEKQKKEKGRKNNKQGYVYASYQAAEMEFFEYYEKAYLPFFYRYFRWFDLNLAYASGYRSFETWLVNGWFKVDLLSDVKDFCQLLVTITWIAFFQHRFNQLCRLLAAVKMFTKRYMMIYFLLLHNFQTTSVNARWGQPFSSNLKAFQNKPQVECFCMLCSCG